MEDQNRQAGKFRHKRQSIAQAVAQSDCIDYLKRELDSLEENLSIRWGKAIDVLKMIGRQKLRFIRAMIRFRSFRIIPGRSLLNEFEMDKPGTNKTRYNKAVLKVHWYPAAWELIKKYVRENIAFLCVTLTTWKLLLLQ